MIHIHTHTFHIIYGSIFHAPLFLIHSTVLENICQGCEAGRGRSKLIGPDSIDRRIFSLNTSSSCRRILDVRKLYVAAADMIQCYPLTICLFIILSFVCITITFESVTAMPFMVSRTFHTSSDLLGDLTTSSWGKISQ